MEAGRWTALLQRIVPQDADDIDALTRAYDARRGRCRPRPVFPDLDPTLHCPNAFTRPDMVGRRAARLRAAARRL